MWQPDVLHKMQAASKCCKMLQSRDIKKVTEDVYSKKNTNLYVEIRMQSRCQRQLYNMLERLQLQQWHYQSPAI